MDNRIFNVNGMGNELLGDALKLAFKQCGESTKAVAWKFIPEKGIVLLWAGREDATKFIAPLGAESVAALISEWLLGDEAHSMPPPSGWDECGDHDGSNKQGWRVYVEDWGHVDGMYQAICAIRPVYLWYGK
jgi:hypothetical protein